MNFFQLINSLDPEISPHRGLSRPLAGPDKLVHLVGLGEVVARLGRGFADRLDRAAQAADDFTYGNQIAALTLHGLFSHLPRQPRSEAHGRSLD